MAEKIDEDTIRLAGYREMAVNWLLELARSKPSDSELISKYLPHLYMETAHYEAVKRPNLPISLFYTGCTLHATSDNLLYQ